MATLGSRALSDPRMLKREPASYCHAVRRLPDRRARPKGVHMTCSRRGIISARQPFGLADHEGRG
jgi:hypothetical protein